VPGDKFEDGERVARSWDHPGMELRDYFAGQALFGIIAAYSGADVALPPARIAAEQAYDYAHAMLAVREKATSTPDGAR
jgi:hypothetical protein